jgi:hypothetical protein
MLILLSILLVGDLFIHSGRPATFDGPTHITTIAQFYSSLKQGEFPVRWSSGYGNYGQPLPMYAHQVTSYLGGLLMFIIPDPILAYNLVILIGSVASTILTYMLLKSFFSKEAALAGSIMFTLTAYRITNLYVRGALPEFFVSTAILASLIFLKKWIQKPHIISFIGLSVSIAGIWLIHPLIALLYTFALSGFLIIFTLKHRQHVRQSLAVIPAFLLALGLAAFYLVPLLIESKYLLITHEKSSVSFSTLNAYLAEEWLYFSNTSHPGPRENRIQFGLPETLILIFASFMLVVKPSIYTPNQKMMRYLIISSCLIVFLTLPVSEKFYQLFPFMGKIQYAWRWFSILALIPPVIIAIMMDNVTFKKITWLVIAIVMVLRLPQAYGKNYYQIPNQDYFQTVSTLHTGNLNTVWMGHWRDYEPKKSQGEIIEGQGVIENQIITNTKRTYNITAKSPIRFVDYTFYFPGWIMYKDGVEFPFEFQDPDFRGIITTRLPPGTYTINLEYQETKVRHLANSLSILAVGGVVSLLLFNRYQLSKR